MRRYVARPQIAENGLYHLLADHLAQLVDGGKLALVGVMPVGPAIAGFKPLNMGAHLVNGTAGVGADDGAVGAHLGGVAGG